MVADTFTQAPTLHHKKASYSHEVASFNSVKTALLKNILF